MSTQGQGEHLMPQPLPLLHYGSPCAAISLLTSCSSADGGELSYQLFPKIVATFLGFQSHVAPGLEELFSGPAATFQESSRVHKRCVLSDPGVRYTCDHHITVVSVVKYSPVELDKLSNMFTRQNVEVQGTVGQGYEKVKEVFENNFRNGEELSAQVCVFKKGKKVVDLWASSVSPSYSGDSVQTIWSSTKNLTALAMAMMVDKGLLVYSDHVAQHWPEFGHHGKQAITIADVLRHEGGLPFFSKQMYIQDSWPENICNNGVGRIIEMEEPSFPSSNTRREYHGITRGFILQEVFRRVEPTGRSVGQFLKEQVFDPLGVDVFIGMDENMQKDLNIADVEALADKDVEDAACKAAREDVLKQLNKFRAYVGETEGKRPDHKEAWKNTGAGGMTWWNGSSARRAEIPSAGGLASARGLAAVANMMALGGKVGERMFLTPAGWSEMHAHPTEGDTFGMKTFYTQGGVNHYQDGCQSMEDEPNLGTGGILQYGQLVPRGMYGWGGYGGSLFLWDPTQEIGFAYIPTYLAWYDKEKQRGTRLLREAVFKSAPQNI